MTNKLKLLVGMPAAGSWGGPIYCEPPFVEALRNEGVEVDEEEYVYGSKAQPISPKTRVARVIDSANRLRQRTRNSKYDVIHLNTSIDEKCILRDLYTMAAVRRSSGPVFLKMHGSDSAFLRTNNPFWRRLQRRLFARASMIGVLSQEEIENFRKAGCPEEKLVVSKYAIPGNDFVIDSNFRTNHGLENGVTIILFSARFIPAKGLLDVIRACADIRKAGHDFVLFCLGDGPDRESAERLAADLELTDRVRFTGYIAEEETAAYHANSDIFVLPTFHDEGFPLVILKSIAAGLPIVTTPIRGAADYLVNGEHCLWVTARDSGDIASKICRLISDESLRQSMRVNNLELARQFSPREVALEFIEVYERMVRVANK